MAARDRFRTTATESGECSKCNAPIAEGDVIHVSENDGWEFIQRGHERTQDACKECYTRK